MVRHSYRRDFTGSAVKSNKSRTGQPQPVRHFLQYLKRRRVPAAFDQAQKINGDPYQFGERFLR
jgi:hypothetical protein